MHLLVARQDTLDAGAPAEDLGQTPAAMVVLSFSDSDLTALADAWTRERDRLPSLRLANLARLGHPLSVDLYVDAVVRRARLVVLRLLGGAGYWRYGLDSVAAACREAGVALAVLPGDARADASLDGYGTVSVTDARRLWHCFNHGGPDNMAAALACAATLAGHPRPVREPEPVPRFGLYQGWTGATSQDAPAAAIVFYRAHLLAGDLEPVHALADALAARGLKPVPMHAASLKEPDAAVWVRRTLSRLRPAVVINLTGFSARTGESEGSPLDAADAPVLQAVLPITPEEAWRASAGGLAPADLAMNVVLPEIDGRIVTRAIAFKAERPVDPALEFAAVTARAMPDRVAAVADTAAAWTRLAATPPAGRRVALILSDYPGGGTGHAVGLDTPASVLGILKALAAAGYSVADMPDSPAALMRALTEAPPGEAYSLSAYRTDAPPDARARIAAAWGDDDADPRSDAAGFRFRAIRCGNIVIAVQPSRGQGPLTTAQHHDPETPPSHGYLAFYLWLRRALDVHALVQLGAHGTLEWLPGKAVALSTACWPEIVGGSLPCLYPFIVNNPGEGVQARRRIGAVLIGHLTPPPMQAGLYGPLAELERALDEYSEAASLDPRRLPLLRDTILDLAWRSGVAADCALTTDDDTDTALTRLDTHLCDIKEMQIRDGLHIFGYSPADDARDRLAAAVGTGPAVTEAIDASGPAEMAALLAGLDGRFVAPGPGGSPARGRRDVLPTGRNLYALDPRAVPTPAAWTLGWKAADAILTRHLQDHGDWPRRLVVDCWGSPAMRTGGDELAQALALMGVRPVWEDGSGRVTGFEILPASVLDRPRVDVTLRISGLFRDVFPQQVALFDQAARAVIGLDEPDTVNPGAASARADAAELIAAGLSGEDADRQASARVFGAPPGGYGTALADLIASGAWRTRADFGNAYVDGGCHAYGPGLDGVALPVLFRRRLGSADALVHHQDQREHDVLSNDGYYQFEGGFAAAAALDDGAPSLYHVDSAEPGRLTVRTLEQEIARTLRGRAANPRWIAGMKRHGYRGAAELAATVDMLFALAATTQAVRSHQFDALHEAYMDDDSVWDFLTDANPAAAGRMAARFAEALDRGLWHPRRNDTRDRLAHRMADAA